MSLLVSTLAYAGVAFTLAGAACLVKPLAFLGLGSRRSALCALCCGLRGECRVDTETRVFATDLHARRRFGMYWAFIYPGSSLIRQGWLAAVKDRAEAGPALAGAVP